MQTVVDDVVVTRHRLGTDRADLGARIAAAASDPVRVLYAAPLTPDPIPAPDGGLLTLTPHTDDVGDDPPWSGIGRLLARLHRIPLGDLPLGGRPLAGLPLAGLPAHGGRRRLEAAVADVYELKPGGYADILHELGRTLLATWPEPGRTGGADRRAGRTTIVHGHFDLAHVGYLPETETLLLTGPETLGLGDPAWDLGVPAGLWAAGFLDDASWRAFLNGYTSGGGHVPAEGEAWNAVDHPAACAVFLATVRVLLEHGYDDDRAAPLLRTCVKMNGRRW